MPLLYPYIIFYFDNVCVLSSKQTKITPRFAIVVSEAPHGNRAL